MQTTSYRQNIKQAKHPPIKCYGTLMKKDSVSSDAVKCHKFEKSLYNKIKKKKKLN